MNKINIKNQQKKLKINLRNLKNLANKTLLDQGVDGKELSILLVDDKNIASLNKQYLNKNYSTDVLAFRMKDGAFGYMHPEILGDVIVSLETANQRGEELNTGFEQEAGLYLVHGILHLLGFDDTSSKGSNRMKKMQMKIMETYA